jgi:HEPN domain-containing protein
MSPRGKSRRPATPADARAWLGNAREFLDTARVALDRNRPNAAAGCAVTAGINAGDAIAAALTGEHSAGQHDEAVKLLGGVGREGTTAARQLEQLLRHKSAAQYDPSPVSTTDARRAVELAERLVSRAGAVVGRLSP